MVYVDLYSDKVWAFSIFSFCTPPGDIYGRPLLIFTRAGAVGNSWWGCIVPLGSPNFDHDPISDEKMSFITPLFGRWLQKSIHVFRPEGGRKTQHTYLTEIISSLLRLERQQKDFFLSQSFIIEATNTFIHYRSSVVNHTRFQTEMGKIYTCFQTKTAPKPHPLV